MRAHELVAAAEQGLISSAHDVAQGGLLVALAESCFNPEGLIGVQVHVGPPMKVEYRNFRLKEL